MNVINKRNISLLLCFITISFYIVLGNCLTFNIGNRMPIKIAEIVAGISCIILLLLHKKDAIRIKKYNIKLFAWFAIAIVPIIFLNYTMSQRIYGLLYPVRIIATILVTIIISNILGKYNITKKAVCDYLIINYLIVVVIGVWQLIKYPIAYEFYDLFYKIGVYYQNPDPHINRMISTYFDPNFLAACLLIPMILSLNNFSKTGRIRYLLAIIIFIVAIITTASRSGVLGVVIAVCAYVVISIKRENKKIKLMDKNTIRAFGVMAITLISFAYMMFFTDVVVFKRILGSSEDQSTYARIDDWSKGLKTISDKEKKTEDDEDGEDKKGDVIEENEDNEINDRNYVKGNYVIGVGYNMLGFTKQNSNKGSAASFGNDSSLLVILISSGIIGSVYMIIVLIHWLFLQFKSRKYYYWNESNLTVILTSIIIANFNNLLFYMLWIVPVFFILNYDEKVKTIGNDKEKRIGIDGRALTEKRAGIGNYTYEIIKELNKIDKENEYFIYSNKKVYLDFELNSNWHIVEQNFKIGTLWLYWILPFRLLKDEIQIFWGTQHCLPKREEYFPKAKYVLTVHDLAILKLKNIGEFKNTIIQKLFLRKSCNNADKIIAISKSTKDDIVTLFGINEEKIRIIYNGTSFENNYKIDEGQKEKILEKFKVQEKQYLMFLSTIEPRKNVITLVRAFEELKQNNENSNLKLLLGGKLGWKYQKVLDIINESKYKSDIKITGYLSSEEIKCLLHNSNCFVYPSLYEGFGLPILEAMEAETLVITSNVSSMPEVGGSAAFYFNSVYDYIELAKQIENVLNLNNAEREVRLIEGKKQCEKFSWKKCTNELLYELNNCN